MTEIVPVTPAPPDFSWGVQITSPRARWGGTARRRFPAGVAAGALLLQLLLGMSGAAMASTSPARADILGISSTVQDWICGIVSPDEPWEGVGDGPESWMSNLNLAGITPAAVKNVTSNGGVLTVPPLPGSSAPTTMDQLVSVPAGSYTLYEIAGLRGLTWWTIPLNTDGSRNCSLWNYVWSQGGNLISSINKTVLQIVISIKESSNADNPLSFLYDDSGGVMSTVFALVFVPIATLMLMCSAIWLGIKSMTGKNGIRAAIGVLGITFGLVALGAFLYLAGTSLTGGDNKSTNGFRSVAKVVDGSISAINAVAANGMFDFVAQNDGTCFLPANAPARGQRITSCVMADALAYRPWEIGQFGGAGAAPIPLPEGWNAVMPDAKGTISAASIKAGNTLPCYVDFNKCSDLRTYLIAQHGGIQVGGALNGHQGYLVCSAPTSIKITVSTGLSWLSGVVPDFGGLDDQTYTIDMSSICSPMFRVWVVLSKTDPQAAAAYSGDVGIARVSQAFSALLGTGVAGIAVLLVSLITMSWQAMTFALYITGGFKLPFAIYAGKAKMAKEWFGDLIYSWLARLAYGIVLNITILLIIWMLSSNINFGMRLVWLAIILFMFFKMMRKIQDLIRPGVASLRVDPMGTVNKTMRQTRHRSVDGFDGMRDVVQRRRLRAEDPTRGRTRRTISAIGAPLTLLSGGLRGAATGTTGAERRNRKAITAALGGRPSTPQIPGRPGPSAPRRPGTSGTRTTGGPGRTGARPPQTGSGGPVRTPRKAGAANPSAARVRDVAQPVPDHRKPPAAAAVSARNAAGTRPVAPQTPAVAPPIRQRRMPPMTGAGTSWVQRATSPADTHPTQALVFGRHSSDSPTSEIAVPRPEPGKKVASAAPAPPPAPSGADDQRDQTPKRTGRTMTPRSAGTQMSTANPNKSRAPTASKLPRATKTAGTRQNIKDKA